MFDHVGLMVVDVSQPCDRCGKTLGRDRGTVAFLCQDPECNVIHIVHLDCAPDEVKRRHAIQKENEKKREKSWLN